MMKRRLAAVVMVCSVLVCPSGACALPAWATDPAVPGPTLPPAGRSLFDFVVAQGVPYPFEALVRKVEARAGCRPGQCVKPVLIPLGRSLQRTVAAPDFFAFPRVVVAFAGEGAGPMLARDRIYFAYQEKANLVEVISYNETAARFEFQLVRDYREGGTPRVLYANRNVCTACHQNHAPIFSRQVWDETNANPKIAARLAATGKRFYGIPVHRGVDIPNAIDDSTDRANRIAVSQRIWREACDPACRTAALTAALQYRLSGERAFETEPLAGVLKRGFAARWPAGLAIPNPDLPNRDPLAFPRGTTGVAQSHVAAAFEPLAPRPPADVWTADDPLLGRRFVTGLAELIAEADVRELVATLTRRAAGARIGAKGKATVAIAEDFASARAAIANATWPDAPFSRVRMRTVLGLDSRAACCEDVTGLGLPQEDVVRALPLPAPAAEFARQCATCHGTPEPFPPNFLAGDAQRVNGSLAQCAPRIFVRLSMWQTPPAARDKVPMPPPMASRDGGPWIQTVPDRAIASLQSTVSGWLRAETGVAPDAAEMLARGYENLRPCLRAGT